MNQEATEVVVEAEVGVAAGLPVNAVPAVAAGAPVRVSAKAAVAVEAVALQMLGPASSLAAHPDLVAGQARAIAPVAVAFRLTVSTEMQRRTDTGRRVEVYPQIAWKRWQAEKHTTYHHHRKERRVEGSNGLMGSPVGLPSPFSPLVL